ncbi:MAG: OprD family outer membrane porin [Hafnia alvei]|uniref:OprD family outer membrane porin n=1 Tax=Hafnia alvei TaxID=569 RepID=UPI003F8ED110
MRHSNITITLFLITTGIFTHANAMDISSGGLFEGSHLDLTLRNIWMLNTTDQRADFDVGDQNAWAQAIHVDYSSGWYQDTVGFDASWYGVSKLYANKDFYGRDLLRDNNGHAEGFNKIGQLFAKAKFGEQKRFMNVYGGWRKLNKFGAITTNTSRAVPSTWEGLSTEIGFDQVQIKAALVNRFSERDEPEKRHFYTLKSDKKIDYIASGDISWKPEKGKGFTYLAGDSKDYLLRQGIEGSWFWPLSENSRFLTRGVVYYNRGLSEWEGTKAFEYDAEHYFGLIGYQKAAAEFGVGWSKTKAHLKDGLGYFYWHMGKNTRGTFNSPADGEGNDYVNDGEQMLYVYSQYQVSPELLVGLYGNYGYGIEYKGVSLKEWEYGGFFSWSPQRIAGLNIFAGFGPAYTWKLDSKSNPSITDDGDSFHRAKGVGAAVRVEYKFGLF